MCECNKVYICSSSLFSNISEVSSVNFISIALIELDYTDYLKLCLVIDLIRYGH